MIIYVFNSKSKIKKIDKKIFDDICIETSKIVNIEKDLYFELSLVEDSKMQNLCKTSYKQKTTTDVLSFPSDEIILKSPNLMGEIFINSDKVLAQSKKYSHSYERELYFLFTHGMLHLLGYDQRTRYEEKEMCDIQKEVFEKISIVNIFFRHFFLHA